MNEKICGKCKINKKLDQYHKDSTKSDGVCSSCKECKKSYRKDNYLRFKSYRKKYNDKIKSNKIKKVKKHKYNPNRKHQERERRKKDQNFRILGNIRTRIYHAMKDNTKGKRTTELLGCSVEYLKKYLENKFTEGMNWSNYGLKGWHIDHIIPCCNFDLLDIEQQKTCFHYTNLQPLWAKDNLKKSKKWC